MNKINWHIDSFYCFIFVCIFFAGCTASKNLPQRITMVPVDSGWSSNSINTVIFRKNSLVTYNGIQYIAYYNQQHYLVLGKRISGNNKWTLKQSPYKGNVMDAHNTISIMTDRDGYLHVAWDHHNNPLHYAKSVTPGSLDLSPQMPMTGVKENKISYPEFYCMPGGDLLFFYRDGGSGNGNLLINRYDVNTKQWKNLHSNLIDGEGKRNAYWQSFVDKKGTIHLSWVWRESPDVASNHDLCYARSTDGGISWERSNGEKYQLPITAANAEYASRIQQKSELINQTSMASDDDGNPVIASYWHDSNNTVPQYHLVFRINNSWQTLSLNFRATAFSLSGTGSKRVPVSRPQVLVSEGNNASVLMLFRDEERGNRVSMASVDINKKKWKLQDLTTTGVGSWEPTYDSELWKQKKILNVFVQNVEQVDAEGVANNPPQMIYVLQWENNKN